MEYQITGDRTVKLVGEGFEGWGFREGSNQRRSFQNSLTPAIHSQVVTDFFDELKSRSQGYASMEYQMTGYRKNDLVRLDIRINNEPAEPLACIVHREAAYRTGRGLTKRLKELIPRQQFKIPIQAAIGAKIVASEALQGTKRPPTRRAGFVPPPPPPRSPGSEHLNLDSFKTQNARLLKVL
jgi:hypothetical protein